MGLVALAAWGLLACGGGAGDVEVSQVGEGMTADGADTECVEVVPTGEAPVTVDRIAFEPVREGAEVYTDAREWTDESIDAEGRRFCVALCACGGEPVTVGRFVVESGGRTETFDLGWSRERCCEAPGWGADAGF